MRSNKINCVIVGLGKVGLTQHMPSMAQTGNFVLSDCVTRSRQRYLQAKKVFPSVQWHKTLDDLLKAGALSKDQVNLAVVCTPSEFHTEESILLLKHGYDLLIEKPVTMNMKEALLIKQTASRLKRKVFGYHNRQYNHDFTTIDDIVSSGKLGEIFQIEIHAYIAFGRGWGTYGYSDWRISGASGGMLYDWGAHMFAQVIQLFPEGIERVYAKLRKLGNFKLVDDHTFIYVESKKGKQAFIFLSNFCPLLFPHWLIIGSKGSLQSTEIEAQPDNWNRFVLATVRGNKVVKEEPELKKEKYNSDILFYQDLYKELTGKKKSLKVTFDDAIQVMKLIDAAFRSDKEGKPVKVN